MTIPSINDIILPLLNLISNQKEYALIALVKDLEQYFKLTETEKNEKLQSGYAKSFYNRVGWTKCCLANADLLTSTKRGFVKITSRGLEFLNINPLEPLNFIKKIDVILE